MIPTGYAQINWSFTGLGVPLGADVTLGVDHSAFSGSATDAAVLARNAWASNLMPVLNNGVTLVNTHVKFGPNATGPSGDSSGSTTGSGANPGTTPQVSFLVHKSTAFGGHAGRGRMFIPGVQESSVDNSGNMDPGTVTALQAAVDGLLDDLATGLLIPVLLHSAASPLTTPSTILEFTVDPLAATQRRRLRR